jgi:DNA invertase Pin-like site-specific DNA recombinase
VAGTRLVLVERLDRLARFLTVQESILQDLKRKQFDLVSVTEPDLCTDDPTRTLMRQVLGAFSEYERSMIVLKLRGARQRMKRKAGRCEGRKPYGRTQAERETILRMEALRGDGTLTSKSLLPRTTKGYRLDLGGHGTRSW